MAQRPVVTPVPGAPATPTQAQLSKFFPLTISKPADDLFEIGLVMGGTVSAGAYTAGVVDMLIEALDTWTVAKERGLPGVPPHRVQIKITTGASGGGVCAAILAKALAYTFPHLTPTSSQADWARNPFYKVWVETLDIHPMLSTSDHPAGGLMSLLNGAPIDQGKEAILGFSSTDPWPFAGPVRPYVANPFPVIFTLGNLRGVPYEMDFGEGKGIDFSRYADYVRYGCDVGHVGHSGYTPLNLALARPDETFVDTPDRWEDFGQSACATGAFPLGFPPRDLVMPMENYAWRVAVLPGDNAGDPSKVVPLVPAWARMREAGASSLGASYPFVCVDGGTFNNEPLQLARTALAGQVARNPRDGSLAHRAIVLIDPLIDTQPGPGAFSGLFSLAGSLVGGLVGQNRYGTADLQLLADPDCYSRFMITPMQSGREIGDRSIAGAACGAFAGFLCQSFRQHDFMLGRANCWEFLRNEFVLRQNNALFNGWSNAMKIDPRFTIAGKPGLLPIIPLLGELQTPVPRPLWLTDVLDENDYARLRREFRDRFRQLIKGLENAASGEGTSRRGALPLLLKAYLFPIKELGPDAAADKAIAVIKSALVDWGLQSPG